jgi:hypothetical protein
MAVKYLRLPDPVVQRDLGLWLGLPADSGLAGLAAAARAPAKRRAP